MRAKFRLTKIEKSGGQEHWEFMAVTDAPFSPDGDSEDNSFARWTPSGVLKMSVANPNLLGKFEVGQKFYLDFTKAE